MTRLDVLKYVESLEPEIKMLFHCADMYMVASADTLSEEFQLAAAIENLFIERAKEQWKRNKEVSHDPDSTP